MVYTYNYDINYSPALPVVEIALWTEHHAEPLTLTALVDSGADATMVPLRSLRQLNAKKGDRQIMRDASGLRYMVDSYLVNVTLAGHNLQLHVLSDRSNEQVLLGRDILNYFVVTLNGLAYTVEISQ
jgi:predicted aspartyl protease